MMEPTPEREYHPDPYIRSLAAGQTKCHGFYDGQDVLCQQCTLTESCITAQTALLSQLAVDLADEDRAKTKPPKSTVTGTVPLALPTAMETFTDKDFSSLDPAQATDVAAAIKTVCRACGKPILKGDPAKWVRSKEGGAKGSAMFHVPCFQTAFNVR